MTAGATPGAGSIVRAMPSRARDAIVSLRQHLDRSLFVEYPGDGLRLGRPERILLVGAFLALAAVLQLFRIGPSIALNSLWAEDGPIFLQGALSGGFFHNLVHTYAGYLVVVPRLIGDVGGLVPLRDAPAAIAITSALVVATSGLVVWIASAGLIRNPWLRGTLAVLTVLAPVASLESIASASYVLWYMLFASFWLLLWRPRTDRAAAFGAVFILLTALSTPEIWFFAPLALLRGLAARSRRDLLLVGAWALGSLVQIPAYAASDETQVEPLWSHTIWTALLQRVLDGAALGERLGGDAWDHLGWGLLVFLLLAAGIGLVLGLRRAGAAARWLTAVAIPIAVAMFVVSAYQRAVGPQMAWPAHVHFGNGGRYTIVPALLLVSVALVLIDSALRRPRVGWAAFTPWIAAAAVAVLLIGLAASFDVREPAVRGTPSWGDALDAAAASCSAQSLVEVPVPISPPPFGVVVACSEVPDTSASPGAR
jgi:hypothetical protein